MTYLCFRTGTEASERVGSRSVGWITIDDRCMRLEIGMFMWIRSLSGTIDDVIYGAYNYYRRSKE